MLLDHAPSNATQDSRLISSLEERWLYINVTTNLGICVPERPISRSDINQDSVMYSVSLQSLILLNLLLKS